MKRTLLLICLLPQFIFAQERKNDDPPSIKQLAIITTMVGWTKNDLGKWSSSTNSLPKYMHNYFFPTCEQILRVELTEINYKGSKMLCVAKFMKSKYTRLYKINIEYPVDYWLFDLSQTDTVIGNVKSVQAIIFNTINSGFFSSHRIATWQDISNDIVTHFGDNLGLGGKFCIQTREDTKNSKFQFLIGNYNSEINDFSFNHCSVPGENNEMENGYYEVPTNIFIAFVKKLQL